MATIEDLGTEVLVKVENRANSTARAYQWLKEAILEITSNPDFRNDFPELEVEGAQYDLTVGTPEYEETNFVTTTTPASLNMATLNFRLWTNPPTNTHWIILVPSHYQKADRQYSANSRPSEWYRFGGNIGFWPPPDDTYQVQARLLRFHPFESVLKDTNLLLTQDWNEIVVLGAAMRGFIELEEYEKAAQIRLLLYGDPKHPEKPGIMYSRKTKHEREAHRATTPLRIRTMRSTRAL